MQLAINGIGQAVGLKLQTRAQSRYWTGYQLHKGQTMKKSIVIIELFGRPERCRILAKHGRYTLDVERMRDGKCFRVSGLSL
jgi:hypothetical protein